jgi:hypothetical protein
MATPGRQRSVDHDDGARPNPKHEHIVTQSPGVQENWPSLRGVAQPRGSAPSLLATRDTEGSNQPRTLVIPG